MISNQVSITYRPDSHQYGNIRIYVFLTKYFYKLYFTKKKDKSTYRNSSNPILYLLKYVSAGEFNWMINWRTTVKQSYSQQQRYRHSQSSKNMCPRSYCLNIKTVCRYFWHFNRHDIFLLTVPLKITRCCSSISEVVCTWYASGPAAACGNEARCSSTSPCSCAPPDSRPAARCCTWPLPPWSGRTGTERSAPACVGKRIVEVICIYQLLIADRAGSRGRVSKNIPTWMYNTITISISIIHDTFSYFPNAM